MAGVATVRADRRVGMVGVVAVLGGFLLGVLDFVWIKVVPFPFGDLGNSSAVWAVAAFAFGYWVRSGWVRAAVGAAVLLVSEDLDEVLELADRVAVMSEGKIAYVARVGETDRATIGRHMAGHH